MLDMERMRSPGRSPYAMPSFGGQMGGQPAGQPNGPLSGMFSQDFGQSRFGNIGGIIQTLGDLLGRRFGGQQSAAPAPQAPGEPQSPQTAQPMGAQYNNPFGASVTGGTLGAMLARQPNY